MTISKSEMLLFNRGPWILCHMHARLHLFVRTLATALMLNLVVFAPETALGHPQCWPIGTAARPDPWPDTPVWNHCRVPPPTPDPRSLIKFRCREVQTAHYILVDFDGDGPGVGCNRQSIHAVLGQYAINEVISDMINDCRNDIESFGGHLGPRYQDLVSSEFGGSQQIYETDFVWDVFQQFIGTHPTSTGCMIINDVACNQTTVAMNSLLHFVYHDDNFNFNTGRQVINGYSCGFDAFWQANTAEQCTTITDRINEMWARWFQDGEVKCVADTKAPTSIPTLRPSSVPTEEPSPAPSAILSLAPSTPAPSFAPTLSTTTCAEQTPPAFQERADVVLAIDVSEDSFEMQVRNATYELVQKFLIRSDAVRLAIACYDDDAYLPITANFNDIPSTEAAMEVTHSANGLIASCFQLARLRGERFRRPGKAFGTISKWLFEGERAKTNGRRMDVLGHLFVVTTGFSNGGAETNTTLRSGRLRVMSNGVLIHAAGDRNGALALATSNRDAWSGTCPRGLPKQDNEPCVGFPYNLNTIDGATVADDLPGCYSFSDPARWASGGTANGNPVCPTAVEPGFYRGFVGTYFCNSNYPTAAPSTTLPTVGPSQSPSVPPTAQPTPVPSPVPSFYPTRSPSSIPTPAQMPTQAPTFIPQGVCTNLGREYRQDIPVIIVVDASIRSQRRWLSMIDFVSNFAERIPLIKGPSGRHGGILLKLYIVGLNIGEVHENQNASSNAAWFDDGTFSIRRHRRHIPVPERHTVHELHINYDREDYPTHYIHGLFNANLSNYVNRMSFAWNQAETWIMDTMKISDSSLRELYSFEAGSAHSWFFSSETSRNNISMILLTSNDAMNCTENQFRCDDTYCIDGSYRCDGVSDCLDDSDEHECDAAYSVPDNIWCADDPLDYRHERQGVDNITCQTACDSQNGGGCFVTLSAGSRSPSEACCCCGGGRTSLRNGDHDPYAHTNHVLHDHIDQPFLHEPLEDPAEMQKVIDTLESGGTNVHIVGFGPGPRYRIAQLSGARKYTVIPNAGIGHSGEPDAVLDELIVNTLCGESLPTRSPTISPSYVPSISPTYQPTTQPSLLPTQPPTQSPTHEPTRSPTLSPASSTPSLSPFSSLPTHAPASSEPTMSPASSNPTQMPASSKPTFVPTSSLPTDSPSFVCSDHRLCEQAVSELGCTEEVSSICKVSCGRCTLAPTSPNPTEIPTSSSPTREPTLSHPTSQPTVTVPTNAVCSRQNHCFQCSEDGSECVGCRDATFLWEGACMSSCPLGTSPEGRGNFRKFCRPDSMSPSTELVTTVAPSIHPTRSPSAVPSDIPSSQPMFEPTVLPTATPSILLSLGPSDVPTLMPSKVPSLGPSTAPSVEPTFATLFPSIGPTTSPSANPTIQPTGIPSLPPSTFPSRYPTVAPTGLPSQTPSRNPTELPTSTPSGLPSVFPSAAPTTGPSSRPTATVQNCSNGVSESGEICSCGTSCITCEFFASSAENGVSGDCLLCGDNMLLYQGQCITAFQCLNAFGNVVGSTSVGRRCVCEDNDELLAITAQQLNYDFPDCAAAVSASGCNISSFSTACKASCGLCVGSQ